MRSAMPKHLHPVLGRRMVDWVLAAASELGAEPLVVVASPDTAPLLDGAEVAVQEHPLGTGDAVRSARAALEGRTDDVLVLSGDTPRLTAALLRDLVDTHHESEAAATVLTFVPEDARAYGRVIRDERGHVGAIVEARDATPEQLAVQESNSSIYVFRSEALWPVLDRLEPANAQNELYLTDAIRLLAGDGLTVAAHVAPYPDETEGVNTRAELALAARALRDRINEGHMLAGVTIVDPESTWIEPTVEIEPDTVVHPFVVLRGTTRVLSGAEIHPHTVAVDAVVGAGAMVGPFCYLRPGTVLEAGSKAGTFVEIKNSRVGAGTKVPHLSYIGDAEIGEGTNIGAGAITANLGHAPGSPKARTTIGDNVKTGIQNAFIAPVEIGDGAWTGAGTVVENDVPPDALAVGHTRQENKEGHAARRRDG
jgi:bifunctional UDP-N-acetylglucosamine pyrophosphorylase/glucosamine-1-phosphate N-acetyltransferase